MDYVNNIYIFIVFYGICLNLSNGMYKVFMSYSHYYYIIIIIINIAEPFMVIWIKEKC